MYNHLKDIPLPEKAGLNISSIMLSLLISTFCVGHWVYVSRSLTLMLLVADLAYKKLCEKPGK